VLTGWPPTKPGALRAWALPEQTAAQTANVARQPGAVLLAPGGKLAVRLDFQGGPTLDPNFAKKLHTG
jgi:hypothetical protein